MANYLIDLYLSPSTQEHNPCVLGDVEETHMNKIADQMEPYLKASGITYARNDRVKMTHWESALDSNRKRPRMHYAMHTNANSRNPNVHGQRCYYRPLFSSSKSVATTLMNWQRKIYREPAACSINIPRIKYTELYTVRAEIAIIDEVAYHTNRPDMIWLHGNFRTIAKNKVQAICSALGKKFVDPYAGQVTPPPPMVTYKEYVFLDGDTLWSISKKFGIPWTDIKRKDGLSLDAGVMRVGDVLLIPKS